MQKHWIIERRLNNTKTFAYVTAVILDQRSQYSTVRLRSKHRKVSIRQGPIFARLSLNPAIKGYCSI